MVATNRDAQMKRAGSRNCLDGETEELEIFREERYLPSVCLSSTYGSSNFQRCGGRTFAAENVCGLL